MTASPVTGSELYDLFNELTPFDADLSLKPAEDRKTILAANANYPFELQVPAFMKAASDDGGSPIMIQFSGNALLAAGRGISKTDFPSVMAFRYGAKLAVALSEIYIDIYKPPFVALALDHFAVPDLNKAAFGGEGPKEYMISPKTAQTMLDEALEVALEYRVPAPSQEELNTWVQYLSSRAYAEATAGFIACLEELTPAWAMIDTEETPPVLNYAISKHVSDLVKKGGFNTMLEAEYGSTGQAGKSQGYVSLSEDELCDFSKQVAGFVKYTGARGISYPIGMEHAAPSAEKHEPDQKRLEAVQREIIKEAGYYAPFAQHGGTGAKQLAKGLVAKNNINTYFLVEMAQNLLGHFEQNSFAVREGKKSSCSSGVYFAASQAVTQAAVSKLEEAGTYGWFRSR